MGNKAKPIEYYKKYIEDNSELYVDINCKNIDNLDGYDNFSDEEIKELYNKVRGCIRRYNNKANNATTNSDVTEVEIATPKSILQDTIKNTLKKNLTYDEWKGIKEVAEKFVQDIEGKMKDAASAAFAEKQAALAKLQKELEELQAKM